MTPGMVKPCDLGDFDVSTEAVAETQSAPRRLTLALLDAFRALPAIAEMP